MKNRLTSILVVYISSDRIFKRNLLLDRFLELALPLDRFFFGMIVVLVTIEIVPTTSLVCWVMLTNRFDVVTKLFFFPSTTGDRYSILF